MPRFCVGLNGRKDNLEKILCNFGKRIYQVYVAAPIDVSPSARYCFQPVGWEELKRFVKLTHSENVRLNILTNANCYSGQQFSKDFLKHYTDFLSYIIDLGMDELTVADPSLIEIATKHRNTHASAMKIVASSFMEVTDPVKAKRVEAMGVDRITLSLPMSTGTFTSLRQSEHL